MRFLTKMKMYVGALKSLTPGEIREEVGNALSDGECEVGNQLYNAREMYACAFGAVSEVVDTLSDEDISAAKAALLDLCGAVTCLAEDRKVQGSCKELLYMAKHIGSKSVANMKMNSKDKDWAK